MGKVHRIKKAFQRVVSQEPLQPGNYSLAGGVDLHVGKRYDGSLYLMYSACWWQGHPYKKLIDKLISEYKAGVGNADKTSAKM